MSGGNKNEKEDEFSLREIEGNLRPAAKETGNGGTAGSEETEEASRESASAVHPETMTAALPETTAEARQTELPDAAPTEMSKEIPLETSVQPPAAASYRIHEVASGETLYGICFNLYEDLGHLDEICRVNGLTDVNSIEAGQKLLVP